MRVVSIREEIRTSVSRFMKAWGGVRADVPVHWKPSVTFGQMRDALLALDLETCSAADIATIIGNPSWARLECDHCGSDVETIVRIGSEPEYDVRWQDLCKDCITEALKQFDQQPHGGSDGY